MREICRRFYKYHKNTGATTEKLILNNIINIIIFPAAVPH
jgi:hypothetical protein